jgi:hypothetical protein
MISPPHIFQHALIIDFTIRGSQPTTPIGSVVSLDEPSPSEAYKLFLQHLRTLVITNGEVHDPIDMVRVIGTGFNNPGEGMWRALDGLKP